MGAVADFVGDVVGGVVEAVGDVVEAVGDVVSDAADWIGDNVVQPILDDPITFIAAAAAYSMGIPGLSFAGAGTAASVGIATTGSRLAQGDDFDDAIKSGALAFAGTGVTNALGAGYTSGGKDFSPNLYSTADDIAASKLASGAVSSNIDDQFVQDLAEGARYSDSVGFEDLASIDGPLELKDTGTYWKSPDADDALKIKPPYGADDLININPADVDTPASARKNTYWDPVEDAAPGHIKDADQNLGGYKSSLGDIDAGMTSDYTDMSRRTDKPAPRGVLDDATLSSAGYEVPIEERVVPSDRYVLDKDGNLVQAGSKPGLESAKNLAGAVTETVGDWIWDGAKWVWNNPEKALALGALGYSLLGDKGGPGGPGGTDGPGGPGPRDDEFNSDLNQLQIQREQQLLEALEGSGKADSTFGRGKNPYESDIYRYGETRGEHGFYGDTTYQPVEYSAPVAAAQGGSIGALNAQMPSYYRYGVMPMAMGGYASGGLRSLKHDGRSDHIPAMLSDGEYVIDAETVALLGNGSNEAGANRLEGMRQEVRKQKGKALAKGKFSSNAKSPLAYIKQRRG